MNQGDSSLGEGGSQDGVKEGGLGKGVGEHKGRAFHSRDPSQEDGPPGPFKVLVNLGSHSLGGNRDVVSGKGQAGFQSPHAANPEASALGGWGGCSWVPRGRLSSEGQCCPLVVERTSVNRPVTLNFPSHNFASRPSEAEEESVFTRDLPSEAE